MAVTASATSSDARPPYSSRDHSSLPVASVPSRCPGENDGRLESRIEPPVGFGTDPISGHRKHRNRIAATRNAGSQMPPSARNRPNRASPAAEGQRSGRLRRGSRLQFALPYLTLGPARRTADRRPGWPARRRGQDEHGALDDRDVARVDRRQQLVADARQPEDLLDDHGDAQQRSQVQCHRGDQAEHGVAHHVMGQDPPLAQPLGPSRGDVVLAAHLADQVGAQQARVEAQQAQGDRHRRQRQGLDVAAQALARRHPPKRRQPVELHGEDVHEHERQDVVGHRQAGHAQDHARTVEQPVGSAGRQQRDGNREHQRDQQGIRDQLERDRQVAAQNRGDAWPLASE